jgi:hypothetical protein
MGVAHGTRCDSFILKTTLSEFSKNTASHTEDKPIEVPINSLAI